MKRRASDQASPRKRHITESEVRSCLGNLCLDGLNPFNTSQRPIISRGEKKIVIMDLEEELREIEQEEEEEKVVEIPDIVWRDRIPSIR